MRTAHPLIENVVELRRRLGSRRSFRAEVVLGGLEISTAKVPSGSPIEVDLNLESISEGVFAGGTVTFGWEGECRRCLRRVMGAEAVGVREVFQADSVEGETWPLGQETIDLEPVVREAVLLALPLAPLCTDGCQGPDPEHFPTGAAGGRRAADGDPRWAALDDLRFE